MTISVIGYDGSPLPPAASDRLVAASLVVGGARQLTAVRPPDGVRRVVMGDVASALAEIDAAESGNVVVVASGDPGFFGIVRALRERGHAVEVIPAMSAVTRAFARAGLSWDDALVVSAHGRGLRRAVNACRAYGKVAVLTAPGAGPAELARELAPEVGSGPASGDWLITQGPRTFVVCEDLGGPAERVERCRPAEATTRTWRDPNVVLVLDEQGRVRPKGWLAGAGPGPSAWALPEAEFEHRDSMVTKAEVRALVLAKLGPRLGDLVWDVGAGSGSMAIECARFGAAVIAVDRDEESCDRIRRNVLAHHVRVAVSRGQAPGVLDHLPDPDAVFVGGGGPDVVRACAVRALRAVVVALAAVDRVRPSYDALTSAGFTVDGVQLQTNRLSALPGDVHRLAAVNPVFAIWGTR